MRPQYTNQLMSSFVLWLENKILTKGEAFSNASGAIFYPINDVYTSIAPNGNPADTFATTFNQILADTSVSGVIDFNTLYFNFPDGTTAPYNPYAEGGQEAVIDYVNGRLYMERGLMLNYGPAGGVVSGNFSVPEYNVKMTNESEEKLLYETKYVNKSKINVLNTGLNNDEVVYPIILVKNNGIDNIGFQFGGTRLTTNYVRCIVLSDSQFSLDGVNSILSDQVDRYIPILSSGNFPYNYLGGLVSGTYNYDNLTSNFVQLGAAAWIKDVTISRFNRTNFGEGLTSLNQEIFCSIIDLELCKTRTVSN